MRRFELVEGSASKFWQVDPVGTDLVVSWGRIGTSGQTQTKSHTDAATAAAAMKKLIEAKTKKGYAEVDAGGAGHSATQQAKPAAASPAARSPQSARPADGSSADGPKPVVNQTGAASASAEADGAPWYADGDPVLLDEEFIAGALPSRAAGSTSRPVTSDELLERSVARMVSHLGTPNRAESDPGLVDRLAGAVATAPANLTHDQLVILCALHWHNDPTVVQWTAGRHGVVEDVAVLLGSYRMRTERMGQGEYVLLAEPARVKYQYDSTGPLTRNELELRIALANAPESDYAAAVDLVRAAWPTLEAPLRAGLALMLPDEVDLANSLIDEPDGPLGWVHWLSAVATDPELLSRARRARTESYFTWGQSRQLVNALVLARGSAAVSVLAPQAAEEHAREALGRIGVPEAITALAAVASSSKSAMKAFNEAVQRWPLAATAGLASSVASGGRDAATARSSLLGLLAESPELADRVRPFLDAPAARALDEAGQQLDARYEEAGADELPQVLVSPPWLGKRPVELRVDDLPVLPVAPTESFAEGERERWATDLHWFGRTPRPGLGTPAEFAGKLCQARYSFTRENVDEKFQQALADALAGRDLAASVAAMGAWCREFKRISRYGQSKIPGEVFVEAAEGGAVDADFALGLWNELAGTEDADTGVGRIIARWGVDALPGLLTVLRRRPAETIMYAMAIGAVELAPVMARAQLKLKSVREDALAWLLKYPEHAVAGLLPDGLGKPGEPRDAAKATLQRFGRDAELRQLVLEVAARHGREDVDAATVALLDEDPLDRYPTKRAKLPGWWQPRLWHRPLLTSGKALGLDAVDHLGTMLGFPIAEDGPYPGIAQVREACDPDSLAEFGWDVFTAWLNSGAATKEAWAMTSLGLVGNDDTARRITPLLRAWPGESQHKRAVTGLDVLAGIGTDLALMQLNGIATKVKFKALQERAREKIDAIAEERGLTSEELEDRLAPDLGLAEDGSLKLDFGPRTFRVGFDETLKPYVRDADGARLKDLPKPRKDDDAELAKAATARWKTLKKDARTVASQQVQRLELAMCARRRWALPVFEQFLAGHPLVRNLVQRLVWAEYPGADEQSAPTRLFRVAEDGEYTDAEDEPITLDADAVVGIPHSLEIDEQDAAAFGQLFTDYELLQPFRQLGREVHRLTDDELDSTVLTRWNDLEVPTGKILGLTSRGWNRGVPMDAGVVGEMDKPVGGRSVELEIDPGLATGMLDLNPEQRIAGVTLGSRWSREPSEKFSVLDPILISELIRDLEGLR